MGVKGSDRLFGRHFRGFGILFRVFACWKTLKIAPSPLVVKFLRMPVRCIPPLLEESILNGHLIKLSCLLVGETKRLVVVLREQIASDST